MGCGASSANSYEMLSTPPATVTPAATALPAEPFSAQKAAVFAELFGERVLSKKGEVDVATAFAGKEAIAIYFSAHWCPPCRSFTPQLAKSYANSLQSKGMEIVFVSSDRSEEDFQGYFKEMPWLAVPYSRRDIHAKLNKKFKVQGIPSLVILDKDGQMITANGRSKVSSDPEGAGFPWKPKAFADAIGSGFRRGDAVIGKDAVAGKTLGIYFSAHWCPPCRGFTPTLAKHYKAYKEKGLPFEIIFCSGDRDEASFESYYKEMSAEGGDWLAMPWSASAERAELNSLFEVSGIPCLVIVDEQGRVINKNARGAVSGDPIGESFPWAPPAVGDLASPNGIQETASVCVLMEAAGSEQQKIVLSQMETVAKKVIDAGKAKGEDPAYGFFAAKSSDGAVPQIRKLCGLPEDVQGEPVMLILDLDDDAFYMSDQSEVTAATIEAFTKSYEQKKLNRKPIQK